MSILQLGKRIFDKRVTQAKDNLNALPRQDGDLPYGAQIGSLMEVPRASFAILDGTLLKVPASAQMQVQAVGRVRLDADPSLEIYRFYTDAGDRRTDAGQTFLQVLVQNGKPIEATYYQQLFRLVPTTAEEQEAYQGQGYGLGELWYNLEADQLAMCGLSNDQIAALLNGAESLDYQRDTPVTAEYVRPYTAIENRLDDPTGMKGMRQKMHFMPYVRELPDGNRENLLISFEVVESVDGARAPSVHVDFLVGLTLEPLKLKVL
ncbi:hypothetical protein WJ96_05885 [Burkholderia ubonensis]|uniref:DUF2491 family protein n=1 Tax=Burkholderia ubonensis TaxID=101571 RepID=A0AAW3MWA2_9BURK|nr:DUF2491 family protein [Burkholderia ubonensis]KVP96754.1 hypothetical protein WJ97_12810 [Burkholderia ubonensis]KVP98099.1 hypothetical protein WJ96_05885 [Burkholderia ubonensis]KVZ92796.1 hypothetical protein WL25_17545 [Burkholderia ubonensis]